MIVLMFVDIGHVGQCLTIFFWFPGRQLIFQRGEECGQAFHCSCGSSPSVRRFMGDGELPCAAAGRGPPLGWGHVGDRVAVHNVSER